jgi:hypothetical protein
MRFPGFIGPSYRLQSINVDCQRCLNLYPELTESGKGKEGEVLSLVGTPGLSLLLTLATSPIRGVYRTSTGVLFAVGGTKLYRISSAWAATEIGTLNSSAGFVSMADNGTTMFLVDGDDGYTHTLAGSSLTTVTDPDWMGATQVVYQDGYFIFLKPNSQQFYISALNDVDVDALDIASSEAQPDNLVSMISDHRELWMFNSNSIEVFFNSGNADFPFERIQGAYIEHGCVAAFCTAKMNNQVFWIGQDENGAGIVYMARGYEPQRISTHAVELAIQSYGDLSNTKAYCYQENGHDFYVLNFESADTTWVYDASTGLWHERAYNNNGVLERHRANFHSYVYSTHVVGDYENGKIYKLSSAVYSDAGDEITRMRIGPHASGGGNRIFYSKFQLDIETGVGLDGTTQGTDPQAMMQFSDDGGHTWSNEKWTTMGKIGQKKVRAKWERLGAARDRVFKVVITDPVKVTMIGADLEFEQGAN